jgi:predicted nucleic acid-binding protein
VSQGGTVLVDSNVLLDIVTDDPVWFAWSSSALAEAADSSRLAINPIVYAEVSVGFDRIEALDEALPDEVFARLALPWSAGFLAGKCFLAYRRAGGTRLAPLPDFYIGAHAAVEEIPLLTRDPSRYRRYLPKLRLIAPDGESEPASSQ